MLYETLTGKRPFVGEDVAETLAAVIRGEPDWSALPEGVSTPIVLVIQGCLEKNTSKRLPDIAAVRFVLDTPALNSRVTLTEASRPAGRWRRRVAVAGAMLFASAVTAVAVLTMARGPAGFPVVDGRLSGHTQESRHWSIRTVRIIDRGEDALRLVTAYPGQE